MTPGTQIIGYLPLAPTAQIESPLANPATAIALANQPTATPDYTACPASNPDTSLTAIVESGRTLLNGITIFLGAGGSPQIMEAELRDAALFDDDSLIRNNYDLTGEGVPELIIALNDPDQGGVLLIYVCESQRYAPRYQMVVGDTAPQVLRVGDMNRDNRTDIVYTAPVCSEIDGLCQYRTGIVTWQPTQGTFVNLLNTPADGDTPPTFGDLDGDEVLEVITRQASRGTTATGPLRTGSQIYDWNGETYVLSLSQPDPVRYVIQVVHEADRAFREERMDDAARLYRFALSDSSLLNWFGDEEEPVLQSYILYRLLLTFAFAENGDALATYQQIRTNFLTQEGDPNERRVPPYALMAEIFWRRYQESNNLNAACRPVIEFVEASPGVLELLNRYGTRNPTYTARLLCPF